MANPTQVDRSPEGGDHEDGRHAKHESAVGNADAPKGTPHDSHSGAQPITDIAEEIADKIERQAKCLEGYAEQSGYEARPVPSVFHLQASHFRQYAQDIRAAYARSDGEDAEWLRKFAKNWPGEPHARLNAIADRLGSSGHAG